MSETAINFCKGILPRVSRSFALTIPRLDEDLYLPILINYLQDRLLDNFEDELSNEDISLSQRKIMMDKVVELFNPDNSDYRDSALEIKKYAPLMPEDSLQELTDKAVFIRRVYDTLEGNIQAVSFKWLQEMNRGMQKYLTLEIETFAQLDEYCYYVAGTVGGFLTDVILLLRDISEYDKNVLQRNFNAAGLFLQKINLVRDIKRDYLKREKVFWPLKSLGVSLDELFTLENKETALLVLKKMLDNIVGHIPNLINYYEALPDDLPGYKEFFCINNALGLATLNKVEGNPDLFFGKKEVKVSRLEFIKILQNPEKSFYDRVLYLTTNRVI